MLCLIKIGYQSFILPDDKGVQTVMRCLSKAIRVENDNRVHNRLSGENEPPFVLDKKPAQVSLELLPHIRLTSRRRPSGDDVLEPEIMPPIRGTLPAASPLRLSQPARQALPASRLRLESGL